MLILPRRSMQSPGRPAMSVASEVVFALNADTGAVLDTARHVRLDLPLTSIVQYGAAVLDGSGSSAAAPGLALVDNRSAFTLAMVSRTTGTSSAIDCRIEVFNLYGWRLTIADYGVENTRIALSGYFTGSGSTLFAVFIPWAQNRMVAWAIAVDIPNLTYSIYRGGGLESSGTLSAVPDPVQASAPGKISITSSAGNGNAIASIALLPGANLIRAAALSLSPRLAFAAERRMYAAQFTAAVTPSGTLGQFDPELRLPAWF